MTLLQHCAPAFRDLGGLAARDGRALRTGRLFRGGALGPVAAPELELIGALGIRTVFDLRSKSECLRLPNGWGRACGAEIVSLSVDADLRAHNHALFDSLRRNPGAAGAQALMGGVYRDFPRAFAAILPTLCARLLQDAWSVLIHCTAGKDRTGFVCALLLHALGVEESLILDDYLYTSALLDTDRLAAALGPMLAEELGHAPDPAALRILCGVQREFLAQAFDAIRTDYGTLDAYLRRGAGLTAPAIAQLRDLLLE